MSAAPAVDAQDTRSQWHALSEDVVRAYEEGRYQDGITLAEQALQLAQQALGPRDPDTLASMNTLAFLYASQGGDGEAEPLYTQALALRRELLGEQHPDTIISMDNLAALHDSQGRYGEAEPLYAQAPGAQPRGPRRAASAYHHVRPQQHVQPRCPRQGG